MKWLITAGIIILSWDANTESDLAGYKVYSRASTQSTFNRMTTVGRQNKVSVKVDGRRNWYFYITAFNTSKLESAPSNIVYIPR